MPQSRKGLEIIEETFDIVLNPNQPYDIQVDDLDVSGVLGNRRKVATIVLTLAKLIDELTLEVENLKRRVTEHLEEAKTDAVPAPDPA